MFATRFDPNILIVDEQKTSSKRKLSDVESDNEDENKNESSDSDEEMKDSSDSGSDSDSSEGSDSESDSSSDSDDDSENDSSDSETNGDDNEDNIKEDDNDKIIPDEKPTSEPLQPLEPQDHDSKFSNIISRFTTSVSKTEKLQSQQSEDQIDEDEDIKDAETHELGPLPQPELPRDQRLSRSQTNNSLNWLATPEYIKTDEIKPFKDFEISPIILKNLKDLGFDNAFATQIKTLGLLLPEINNKLNPNSIKGDLLVNASTGSGKTLAYTIPIIQSLQNRIVPRLRCIILVPTKPLINQVYKTMDSISKGIDLNIVTLGKSDLNLQDEHLKLIKNVPDIIISTPGRLVDHLNLKSIDLKNLQWCVIDEADRLLNQSFQDWSNVLITKLNDVNKGNNISKIFKPNLIKMIFSATLTTDSGKLSNLNFHNPRLIIVNNEESILQNDKIFTLPTQLSEHTIKLSSNSSSHKPLYLLKLFEWLKYPHNVLIFTKSNESTLRLSRLLSILVSKLSIPLIISNINSSQSRSEKSKLLKQFSEGSIHILISTDLISRGIDILTIQHVINYDLPNSSREYVHRVGRTARANNKGDAYNFLIGKGEVKFWNKINLDINRNEELNEIELEKVKDMEQVYVESLGELEKEVFNK
ncbi:ATP-dependent RNA helicase [Wickerhamomyces ciferrii]|uniref:ATP-dependent RNA helicase n=1 Tax=Wickerhamomyces ciferrii (strain ATCC 14091 / BCRC 22168 / CBS 111 / JCM 3599 / NBRC 0793 / NRRL Y-1031 F-60-10) TaxID=1206466 RepID=K0KP58_WICCF|nr:ATP-dependent RNA helicase [Wickerhamomyces ciferrii]CCH47065.1 ATP-dependent RNA helicase [Wickerhamomyces ciferrii]